MELFFSYGRKAQLNGQLRRGNLVEGIRTVGVSMTKCVPTPEPPILTCQVAGYASVAGPCPDILQSSVCPVWNFVSALFKTCTAWFGFSWCKICTANVWTLDTYTEGLLRGFLVAICPFTKTFILLRVVREQIPCIIP